MSSIPSTSGLGTELAQLRQLFVRQGSGATDVTQTGASRSSDARRAEFEAKFKEAALATGLDPTAADGLQEEIQTAVRAAAQTADSTTDRRQVIQGAIDGVLQKHGVNLEKFKSQMQSAQGSAGGPPPGGAPPDDARRTEFEAKFTEAAVSSGLDADAAEGLQDEIQSAISATLSQSSESTDPRDAVQSAIDNVLQQHGVDLDKFRNQLQLLTGATQGMVTLVDEQA